MGFLVKTIQILSNLFFDAGWGSTLKGGERIKKLLKWISSQYIPCDTRNFFIIFCSFDKTSVTSLFLNKSSLLLLVIIRWCSQQHFDACYEISAHCFILPSHPQKTARSRLDRHRSLSEHANRSPGCTSPSKQWWPCTLITASLHCLVCLECRETGSMSETFDPFI